MEVVILEQGLGPDATDHLGKGRPHIKDDGVALQAPGIEAVEKGRRDPPP